jgi:hypothetical protein
MVLVTNAPNGDRIEAGTDVATAIAGTVHRCRQSPALAVTDDFRYLPSTVSRFLSPPLYAGDDKIAVETGIELKINRGQAVYVIVHNKIMGDWSGPERLAVVVSIQLAIRRRRPKAAWVAEAPSLRLVRSERHRCRRSRRYREGCLGPTKLTGALNVRG